MLALPPLGEIGIPFLPTFCAADAGNEISATSAPDASANAMRDILGSFDTTPADPQYSLLQRRLQNYFYDRARQERGRAPRKYKAQELLSCAQAAASNHACGSARRWSRRARQTWQAAYVQDAGRDRHPPPSPAAGSRRSFDRDDAKSAGPGRHRGAQTTGIATPPAARGAAPTGSHGPARSENSRRDPSPAVQ